MLEGQPPCMKWGKWGYFKHQMQVRKPPLSLHIVPYLPSFPSRLTPVQRAHLGWKCIRNIWFGSMVGKGWRYSASLPDFIQIRFHSPLAGVHMGRRRLWLKEDCGGDFTSNMALLLNVLTGCKILLPSRKKITTFGRLFSFTSKCIICSLLSMPPRRYCFWAKGDHRILSRDCFFLNWKFSPSVLVYHIYFYGSELSLFT